MGVSKKETEQRLKEAFRSVTPDLRERVIESASKAQGDVIPMVCRRRRRTDVFTRVIAAAAALLLIVNLGAIAVRTSARQVDSVIQLDVNPSIQMEVNRLGRVITARALNEDAQRVIGTMDLSGATTQVAVNAVVGALYQAGYLQQETNSILVSVSGRNTERSLAVQEEVVSDIGASLNAYAVDASILSQTVTESESLSAQATGYGISAGKALLIDKILAVYPYYTEEELAKFTINELNQLLDAEAETKLADVSVTTVSASTAEPVLTATAENEEQTAVAETAEGATVSDNAADAEDGQAPADWDIMDYAVGTAEPETEETVSENAAGDTEEEEDPSKEDEDAQKEGEADGEERSASENSVSENSISENATSESSASENSVSGNSVSANGTE